MIQGNDLHIVVFTDTFFETNGVASFYRTMLKWCSQADGVRMTILCPPVKNINPSDVRPDVIPVRPVVNWRNPFYPDLRLGYFHEPTLRKLVRSFSDTKVIHVATSGPLGIAGAVLARRLKLPVVGCYHTDLGHYARLYGQSVLGPPGAWLGKKVALMFDRAAYGRCLAVCAPSTTAQTTVRTFYQGPTEIIPNPVDVDRFRPSPSRAGEFRNQYCGDRRLLAAVVGRVAKEKNLDLVCELLGQDTRVQTIFVGDGPYASTLRKRWNAKVTGFLHGTALLEAYQQSDVFVQLSTSETFGLSLVEALACGLPAMVLRSQGLAGCFTPESGVEVLEREDLPTLADRCVSLVRDREQHRVRSRRVREFALTLGVDVVIPKFIEFHRAHAM